MAGSRGPGDTFEAIVIGTGQGGKPVARELAAAGKRTAIVERGRVGGTCVLTGCTPTKAMVASARIAHLARHAGAHGVRTGEVEVDLAAVIRRKRQIVDSFSEGSKRRLEKTGGLELIFGEASFRGPGTVEVQSGEGAARILSAPWIFINTGTRTAVPGIRGIHDVPFLDHASLMELEEMPDHLLIVGGGYVGVEFGQMFRRFGSAVTIIQRGAQLLSREDRDVASGVAEVLREDGVDLLLEATPVSTARTEAGGIELVVKVRHEEQVLTGTHLLVAAGRTPNTDGLGLESAGVRTDRRGFIQVDEALRTSAEGVWALGDVTGGPAFTHVSYDDSRILKTNLLQRGRASVSGRLVPYTVFTDPQLGRVGLSEEQAREKGLDFRVARLPMENVARAVEMGETRGFMKVLVEKDSGSILGAAILGVEGGEVMSILQTAMMGGLPYTALKEGIYAHPTLAESLNNLFMTLDS